MRNEMQRLRVRGSSMGPEAVKGTRTTTVVQVDPAGCVFMNSFVQVDPAGCALINSFVQVDPVVA